MSFSSFKDKLKYLIGINRKELISKIQERDIYNPEIIINKLSPLEIQFRPYVVITRDSYYKANPYEYKNINIYIKHLYLKKQNIMLFIMKRLTKKLL